MSSIEEFEKRFRGFALNAASSWFLISLLQSATQPLRDENERVKHNWTQWAEDNDVGRKFGKIKL